jgi:hypothetical protein
MRNVAPVVLVAISVAIHPVSPSANRPTLVFAVKEAVAQQHLRDWLTAIEHHEPGRVTSRRAFSTRGGRTIFNTWRSTSARSSR